jgi:hypothetical protein
MSLKLGQVMLVASQLAIAASSVACGVETSVPGKTVSPAVEESTPPGPTGETVSQGAVENNPPVAQAPSEWMGWRFYTDAHDGEPHSYTTAVTSHPQNPAASCATLSGDFDVLAVAPMHAHVFGIESTVAGAGQLRGTITYRSRSEHTGSVVTNFGLYVLDANGAILHSSWPAHGGTLDTGYQTVSIPSVPLKGSATVRLVLEDRWTANWKQTIEVCLADLNISAGAPVH